MSSEMPARFYFDFISPYSYLAMEQLHRRRDLAGLSLDLRPVVLGSVFSKLGVRGPGEVPMRRRAALADVLLLADHHGIPLRGPPAHPFNSIYALRVLCRAEDEERRRSLARILFRRAWGDGEDLEDLGVLRAALEECGLDYDPEEAATSAGPRRLLKAYTAELLEAGGFGVPTFAVADRLFFGQDRLDLLLAYVSGRARLTSAVLEEMLARPGLGRSGA